ncbi:type II secretion system F family protein [Actinocorallia aurantiaca]|uniref:Type II secretion system F family protein n=1 Tax=Actinocorallia aurantiaca TaxID=46204 RepID=A0ABN3U3D7_9ACTN
MSPQTILVALAVTLLVAVFALRELNEGWQQRRRLLASRSLIGDERRIDGLWGRLDTHIRRVELGRYVGRRLAAAGVRIPISVFLSLMAAGVVVTVVFIGSWIAPLFGIAAAAVVIALFFSYLSRQEERRKEEFIAQLPELARVLSNATNAGLVLRTAVEIAAGELADPAGAELQRTADALKLGQPVEEALRDLGERLPSRELAVLVSTLVVSARAGGSLVTALRTIADTLEDRKEVRREVKTIMGEAVVGNWAIGAMGLGSLVLVNLMQPGALRSMSESTIGQVLLGVAAVLFVSSILIIRRITRIDI